MSKYTNVSLLDSFVNLNLTDSICNKSLSAPVASTAKTPCKTPGKKSNFKTPKVTPSAMNNTLKTPVSPTSAADRYIPNRNAMNFEINHHLLTQGDKTTKENDGEPVKDTTINQSTKQQAISEALNCDLNNHRILCFNDKAPLAPEGHANSLKVLYSSSKISNSCKKSNRHIPSQPERILDAPDIKNDYYLQLLDWNSNNLLAVALDKDLYLWNASNGSITKLVGLPEGEYISSVAWFDGFNNLAVGTSNREVQLWDAEQQKRLRIMQGHTARVSTLAWNSHVLSSGSRNGQIFHHDVRVAQHHIGTLNGHEQEVCGLKWSAGGNYLASGGNDNVVNIWNKDPGNDRPLYTFNSHTAAVKALAWSPWKPNLLATGGGTADRHIKIWNVNNGSCLYSVDAKSQVCAILWSKEYQELISAHGYSKNELIVWKYPGVTKITELRGHTQRILGLSMSPDGSTVVSLSADETLRFWECFQVDNEKKKKAELKAYKDILVNNPLRSSIR